MAVPPAPTATRRPYAEASDRQPDRAAVDGHRAGPVDRPAGVERQRSAGSAAPFASTMPGPARPSTATCQGSSPSSSPGAATLKRTTRPSTAPARPRLLRLGPRRPDPDRITSATASARRSGPANARAATHAGPRQGGDHQGPDHDPRVGAPEPAQRALLVGAP